ncbi:MAG: cellulase family glycosylhydrolase [Chloroflexi bacterium]|nr:cellulase family glycosylhydrolase [Chloroflexota bacterium]OJV94701.1 MAG: hypothetical protein BGO39_23565 [Chloroflexi bacterium 54-19]
MQLTSLRRWSIFSLVVLLSTLFLLAQPFATKPALAAGEINYDQNYFAPNLPTGAANHKFGIVTHPWWLDMHLDTFISNFKNLQVGVVRIPVEWKTIEPKPGVYNWQLNDRLLNRLADEGFEVVAEFVTIPVWASNNPAVCAKNDLDCGFNPAYLDHMQAVAEALARRYPFIRHWEFWNEPEQWSNAGRDICKFSNWLEQFYLGIKKADPTMLVAFNTLAGINYLIGMYGCVESAAKEAGTKPFYFWDAVSLHPYNLDGEKTPEGIFAPISTKTVEQVHQAMVDRGEGNKPIWITEMGVQSDPKSQADLLKVAWDWLGAQPYITIITLHMLHDWSEEHYGLMTTEPETYQYKGDITPQTKFIPKQPYYDAYKNYPKSPPVNQPLPTDDMLVFPQTGHTVRGIFKKTWETRGGLALFGYPKTSQFYERNEATGQYYLVQYFERVRMEYHPELAGTPYEVQFGLLGTETMMEQGLLDKLGQPATTATLPEKPVLNGTNVVFFPETGHNLEGLFLEAWQQEGGLAVIGYPRSSVFETTGDDGQPLTVQYFERARMELHTAPDGHQFVLFGLLANQRLVQEGRLAPSYQPNSNDYYNPANFEFILTS